MKNKQFNVMESILYDNGYYKLDYLTRSKWDKYIKASSGEKYSSYFSWDDFCSIFAKTTFVFYFFYEGREYSIGKENALFSLTEENNGVIETCRTPEELLNNAKINGKKLSEIYNDLLLN